MVSIKEMTPDMLRPIVDRAANFMEMKKGKPGKAMPPISVIKSILAQQHYEMPPLKGLISAPALRPDGSMLVKPGYDAATGLYYHSPSPLAMPEIPQNPTQEDARNAARFLIEEVLWDFPFDGKIREAGPSRTNALAGLISPIIRPMIDGKMPMLLIDKPSPGTGATLLMDL